jgi:hypothetical protein
LEVEMAAEMVAALGSIGWVLKEVICRIQEKLGSHPQVRVPRVKSKAYLLEVPSLEL